MLELRLYMAQRITALIMAPLVIGHIAVMIYAVQGGLSAGEILGLLVCLNAVARL